MEAGAGHSAFHVFVLHKLFPHKAGAMIFRHQHGDSQVDAEDIRVVPIYERIESVAEAVLGPHLFAVRAAEMAQHADAIVEEKRKGAARGARDDSAIYRANRAASRIRAAPRGVAFYVVGGADA